MAASNGPVIVITGTPGTGKSTHAQLLATEAGLKHINVGEWVKEKGLYEGYDEEWQSYTVDEDRLLDELEPIVAGGGIVLDWHTCEIFPERWADLVVVLTCDHTRLWDRLEKRGYPLKKIQENNEAEIMQVVLEEARSSYPAEIVVELKSEQIEDLESNVSRIVDWIGIMTVPLYEASSQFRNWRYSLDQLADIRKSLNDSAVAAIRSTFEAAEPGSSANVSFLDADEELLLVKLYVSKITQLCALFRFPEEVEATAMTYLKRFYLKNTVMDWHPKNVMLTALFLATKTTNNPISIDAYVFRIPNTAPSDVLNLEFLVAQSLEFEFAVWHAHRALWGAWLDLQNLPEPVLLPMSVYDAALGHIRASRLTDAEFIYAPSQIALSALSLAAPEAAVKWIDAKISPGIADSMLSVSALKSIIETIQSLIMSSGRTPEVESVREVDRRLRICKNPEKVPGTKAYEAKKVEEERLAEEKRVRKIEVLQGTAGDDPFGEELKNDAQRPGLVDYDDDDDDD
ncbi:hypothetical protein APHAL10511_006269 [Amanita phalloides]|nr:hypothetical protein APHAL10511_006269 [Amanita phalloides]